jgi:hypothetical protein
MLDDAKYVDGAVVALELAIAIVGAEPLVDDLRHRDTAAFEAERAWQLHAGVATGFDVETHGILRSRFEQASSVRRARNPACDLTS